MRRFYQFLLAGMAWNHWPGSNGIGGRDGMSGPGSRGIGGRDRLEYAPWQHRQE